VSPAVNVDLEDVPFAILEMVKARILANRRRLNAAQQLPISTKPRPQFRKFGANSTTWRRPEPAAVSSGSPYVFGHAVNNYALNGGTYSEPILVYNGYIYPSPRPQTSDPVYFSFATGIEIAWSVKSGNRVSSIAGTIATPTVSLPTGEITFSESVQQEVGNATIRTEVIEVKRIGTANNQPFEQSLGSFTYISATFYTALSAEQFADAVAQLGGPWQGYQELRAPILQNAPPPPPGHTYSVVEDIQVSVTNVDQTFLIKDRYVYAYSWNTQALSFWRQPTAHRIFVMPAGDDACILVLMSRYAHAFTVETFSGVLQSPVQVTRFASVPLPSPLPPSTATPSTYSSVVNKAYLCSTTTIRELAIPNQLNEILQILNPPFDLQSLPGSTSIAIIEGSDGFYSENANTWTPAVFATLNAINQFIDPESLKTLPTGTEPALADNRDGFYSGDSEDQSHYYAIWIGDSSNVDLEQTQFFDRIDDATLEIDDAIDAYAGSLHVVWDWNDPDYCRAMCQALGFPDADLTP
jgi:hypothetical protein